VTSCGSCKNRRFGGTYRLHYQGGEKLLVAANIVVISLILFYPDYGGGNFSETSGLTRVTHRNTAEDIRHCYRLGNIPEDGDLRPYTLLTLFLDR
jgi:hypothetical protein